MIDPKFNEIATEPDDLETRSDDEFSAEEATSSGLSPRRGLSINETVAADANLSVGGRGVDVSGVRSGAGAGAGMTMTTPGERGESPAPQVMPGASSTGTTPRGEVGPDEMPSLRLDEDQVSPTYEEISARAYQCWLERGSPEGSAEEDWSRAERELRAERRRPKTSAASA